MGLQNSLSPFFKDCFLLFLFVLIKVIVPVSLPPYYTFSLCHLTSCFLMWTVWVTRELSWMSVLRLYPQLIETKLAFCNSLGDNSAHSDLRRMVLTLVFLFFFIFFCFVFWFFSSELSRWLLNSAILTLWHYISFKFSITLISSNFIRLVHKHIFLCPSYTASILSFRQSLM